METIKRLVERIYSEDNDGIGEWEPIEVEGLGWVIYSVQDNAGSIILFITKEKVVEPPEEDYISFKVGYYGSLSGFGRSGENGNLYFNLIDNTYKDKIAFNNNEEVKALLIEKLEQLI